MKAVCVQIVGRIPGALSRRVRAAARRRKVSLNTFVIDALAQAVAGPRQAIENRGLPPQHTEDA